MAARSTAQDLAIIHLPQRISIKVKLSCLSCGSEIYRFPSQVKKQTFCSKECSDTFGLSEVTCSIPFCKTVMPCRVMMVRGNDNGPKTKVAYKINLVKAGDYTSFPICPEHRKRIATYIGPNSGRRLTNGRSKFLSDPDHVYDSRFIAGNRFFRFIVFESAKCKCEGCDRPLLFDEKKSWNIDHRIPVYKGGLTTLRNLQLLCVRCHREKTSIEKSEVAIARHREKRLSFLGGSRSMTHPEKDRLIISLREKIAYLQQTVNFSQELIDHSD